MKKKIVFISIIIAIIAITSVFLYNTYATDPVSSNDSYAVTLSGDTTVSVPANSSKIVIYQIKNTNNGTVKYGIGYTSTNGNSVVKIFDDSTDPATGTMAKNDYKYIKIIIINNSNTPDTVTLSTILGYENGGDLIVPSGVTIVTEIVYNAADYITNLYTEANKSTATVNSITYNLAPSVNLMNDRHASMSTDINGGDIRFYGANPNNYVWLGDSYTENVQFSAANGKVYTSRNVGDKKLWRIIGVFDGKLKLMSNDPITSSHLSWDASASTVNEGFGINEWSQADLMKLLNPGYENNNDFDTNGNTIMVNNSLYWTKGTGTVYTGKNNATTVDVSFASTGLSNSEKNMIDTAAWYLGAYNGNASYVDVQYASERQSNTLGKICSSGNRCNDDVVRTAVWNGKVGLLYPSDFGYATDLSLCSEKLYNYNDNDDCYNKNWIKVTDMRGLWTISPEINPSYQDGATHVCYISNNARIFSSPAMYGTYFLVPNGSFIKPSIYLKSSIAILDGEGSETNPYVLG